MIIGYTGFAFQPAGFPSAGTFISDGCTFADGYDYTNTYYSGDWNYSVTRADGAGGSYTTVENSNVNGCYIPSGYYYYYSSSIASISWNHGTSYGNFEYGSSYDQTLSDGAGGSYSESGGGISAADGTVVNSYEYTDGITGYQMNSVLKFLVSDTTQLHVFNYPIAGTSIGSSCNASNTQDAQGTVWVNINYQITAYADGNGGSYYGSNNYNTSTCGYLPSGFYESYSNSYRVLTYSDEYGVEQTFTYGQDNSGYIADGVGGSNYNDTGGNYYSYGHVFYSYYDSAGMQTINYAFDGNNGYYTYTS